MKARQMMAQPPRPLEITTQPLRPLEARGQPPRPLEVTAQPLRPLEAQGQPPRSLEVMAQPPRPPEVMVEPSRHPQWPEGVAPGRKVQAPADPRHVGDHLAGQAEGGIFSRAQLSWILKPGPPRL